MRKLQALLVAVVTVTLLSGGVLSLAQSPAAAAPRTAATKTPAPGWPRTFDRDGAHVVVYQPQLKSWQRYRELVADTAISITPTGGKQILGVISWNAETVTDVNARTVYIHNVHVLSSRFPSLDPEQEAQMQQRVQQIYPTFTLTIGLDRTIASLKRVNSAASAVAVNTPPPIFVSTVPAIVLFVDGKPVLAPIQGSTLQYIVNTNWDLFYDNSNYYLLSGKTWLKATELRGPWSVATKLPVVFAKLPAGQNWDDVLKAIPPATPAQPAPKVYFTEKPAELLAFKGKPAYLAIPGTQLAYASNAESSVFIHHPDDQVYALISGRWFRAANLDAPWVYAGNDLPADFAKIPRGHSYSAVLVSVPGTQEASDAVLVAQIPTTALVNRAAAEAQVKVSYAGDPNFVPIESTTLSYASNSPDKVIRVGDLYYLCSQGVWFRSTTPNGPWKTADSVPQVIYTIPPSSPVYNVTYVTVSNPTPTTVETSYSSGYLGMFVVGMAVGAAVVYGTGYYYPPYVYWGPRYPIYYPYPYTYGVAAVYNPYTGAYGVGRVVYGPSGSAGSAAWYNPATGMYGHAVTTQNAYGGHTYASAYNPWTGTYAATSQGHNQYSQWGSSVVANGDNWAQAQHVTNANGTAASFQTSKGSAGAGFSGANGNSGFVAKDANNNNVYAGADGNVYKKDSSGDWSKWDNGSWTPVDPSTGAAQTKKQDHQQQNPTGSRQGANSQSQNLSGATANGAQQRNGTAASAAATNGTTPNGQTAQRGSRDPNQTTPATQTRPAQPTQTPSKSAPASGTMGQLQNDASSRARGNQLEQQSRGGARGGSARGSGGGGRPHR